MTSLLPREPYTKEELETLYPKDLKLQLVQVVRRAGKDVADCVGERTPVSARFQNAGLAPYWPYCNVARRMTQMAASSDDLSRWNNFDWKRTMETFGDKDEAIVAKGVSGEIEAICQPGELTDRGRQTTYELGQRLRHLYVDQLGFMPAVKSNAEDMYLRTTPLPRALESLQQTFLGMYPSSARTQDFPPPVIVARSISEETLLPNEGNCRRFRQLSRMFAERAAEKWNNSEEMAYLNNLWSKWMPEDSPRVAVDAHPRLSGIMDTINASDAHGPATRLPAEFYDKKGRELIDLISSDEWYSGYQESNEYRRLGIGGLMGDVVDRMIHTAIGNGWRSNPSVPEHDKAVKFSLSGCHDTTIAAILGSLHVWDGKWPPFTSSVAIELFSKSNSATSAASAAANDSLSRTPVTTFPPGLRKPLQETYFVQVRFNDRVMRLPGCAKSGNHLPGDETFCTLDAFKNMVDQFTPSNWTQECLENLGQPLFGVDGKEKITAP